MRDRWIHVKEIFSTAVATPPHKRRRLLVENCNGDEALLREVEELLSAHEGAGEFLEKEIASIHDLPISGIPEDPSPGDDFSGKKLGAYRLERPVGEGGMGTVYLARRSDELFEKRVAVKIIRRYHDERRLDRFRKEREILARLTHPNIAQLLDGGVTEDGLPYLVMEYVDGTPIDQHCTEYDLDLRERLELFNKVFRAVQYAHQSLIVHRDLKPSNILVTREGEPKLLDFGIAKLLEDDGTSGTTGTTFTVARWMTPEYASPEQVRGDPITTASDVYSLGVILYKLLTGQSPYEVHSQPIYEVERIICEEEPSRPSTIVVENTGPGTESRKRGTRSVRLRRGLKGDLDNIILMALRKEAHRRYPSVEQFGEDIDRYLNGLPVRAQRDTVRYRATKFVQRHQFGVATVVVFLLFAFGAFGFIVKQTNEARHQRDVSSELLRYTVSLFEASADPEFATDTTLSARQMLDSGLEKAREQLSDQPEQLVLVLNLLGRLYQKLGVYTSAEEVHREALGMVAEDGGGLRLADAYFGLGRSMQSQARYDQAESLYRDALELRREYLPYMSAEVAEVIDQLASLAVVRSNLSAADSLVDEAILIRKAVFGIKSEEVARSLRVKATGLRHGGKLDEAALLFQEALAIQTKTLGPDHLQVAYTLNSLGVVYETLGDHEEAERLIRRALRIKRIKLGQRHPSVAVTLYNLSLVMQGKEEFSLALGLLEEALSIETDFFGENNVTVARTRQGLAVLLKKMGNYAVAAENYKGAIAILQVSLPPDHSDIAAAMHNYAILLREMGDIGQSRLFYEQAAIGYRKNLPQEELRLSGALNGLGKTLRELGRDKDAVAAFQESLEIREDILPEGHWRLGTAHSFLGEAMMEVGDPQSEYHLLVGLEILRAALGDDNSRTKDAQLRVEHLTALAM